MKQVAVDMDEHDTAMTPNDLEARAAMLDRKEAKLVKKEEKLGKKVREGGWGVARGHGREALSPTSPATIANKQLSYPN